MKISQIQQSALVSYAEESKRNTPLWLAYVLFIVVGLGFLTIGVAGALKPIIPATEGSFLSHSYEVVMFSLQIAFLALWLKFFERRDFSSIGLRCSGWLRKFGIGLVIGIAMNLTVAILLVLLGGYSFAGVAPDPDLAVPLTGLVIISLGIVIIQATGEELWFRGFLLQTGARKLPGIVAITLPAVVFWLAHMVFDIFGAINMVIFGILAGLIALKQGHLFTVAGIHTGWNWFMGNVIGAPVSGIAPREATWLVLAPNDDAPGYLNGSGLGLEGTIVCTLVWSASLVAAYIFFRKAETHENLGN